MLKTKLINPDIIREISKCGHGDKILITDANYPLDSKTGNAVKLYPVLKRDCPTATDVLEALLSVINIEAAEVMAPEDGTEPEIFKEFRDLLPGVELKKHSRYGFYDAASEDCVRVAILSGESRIYANVLVTVGIA